MIAAIAAIGNDSGKAEHPLDTARAGAPELVASAIRAAVAMRELD